MIILQSSKPDVTAYYCPIHKVDDFPRTFPGTWKNCALPNRIAATTVLGKPNSFIHYFMAKWSSQSRHNAGQTIKNAFLRGIMVSSLEGKLSGKLIACLVFTLVWHLKK